MSLLEIVISMGLFILTITATIFVMQAVLEASRRSEQVEQVQERMLVTLDDLSGLCRQANVWVVPAPADLAEQDALEFELPDPRRDAERWPFPVPEPPAGPALPWNPRAADRQVRLRFFVSGETLRRRIGTVPQTWSPDIRRLKVQRTSPMWLQLSLQYLTTRGPQEVTGRVLLPLQRGWTP